MYYSSIHFKLQFFSLFVHSSVTQYSRVLMAAKKCSIGVWIGLGSVADACEYSNESWEYRSLGNLD
jgi:hypothetical protein